MVKTLEKELAKIRKDIPDKYNQLEFLDYLGDDDIDIMMSITTRGDGKTFNTIRALLFLAIDLGFKTCIVTRHSELVMAYIQQIQKVVNKDKKLKDDKFNFFNNFDISKVMYGECNPFIVCDLNNAGDLKHYSGTLEECNLIMYDEFLAVGGEYTNREFDKYKTIFETMDRDVIDPMQYTNNRRKAIFLANPVDFNSEFLAVYDLYEQLASQPLNTIEKFKNLAIERRQNTFAQENKNNRMFPADNNESITGNFRMNLWGIQSPNNKLIKPIIVKAPDKYIKLYLEGTPIIEVTALIKDETYQYNIDMLDNTKTSVYLDHHYIKETMYKLYNKGAIKFANQYSKNYIFENYPKINFKKVIKQNSTYIEETNKDQRQIDEQIEYQRIKSLKRQILNSFT